MNGVAGARAASLAGACPINTQSQNIFNGLFRVPVNEKNSGSGERRRAASALLGRRIRRMAGKKNRKELPSWLNEFLLKRRYMLGAFFAHLL
jgi:hypothetical protein